MTQEQNWGAEAFRAPDIEETDTIIFSECGRVLDNVCYRAYYFRIVKAGFGGYYLLVKHGGGQERLHIGYRDRFIESLRQMDSDNRYFMIFTLYDTAKKARRDGETETASAYRMAHAEGRLKKRKLPGRDAFKIWIERKVV